MSRLRRALAQTASYAVLNFAYAAQVTPEVVSKQDKKLAEYAGQVLMGPLPRK